MVSEFSNFAGQICSQRENCNPDKTQAVLIVSKNISHSMFSFVYPLYELTLTWQGDFKGDCLQEVSKGSVNKKNS